MKGKHNLGYKLLLAISLLVAILNAAARDFRDPFFYEPADEDSTRRKKDTTQLKFPITDNTSNPAEPVTPSIDLQDPSNIKKNGRV